LEFFTRNFAYYTLELFEGPTVQPIDEFMILVEGRLRDNRGWLMMVACCSRRPKHFLLPTGHYCLTKCSKNGQKNVDLSFLNF
jgi:hypothetical protein